MLRSFPTCDGYLRSIFSSMDCVTVAGGMCWRLDNAYRRLMAAAALHGSEGVDRLLF